MYRLLTRTLLLASAGLALACNDDPRSPQEPREELQLDAPVTGEQGTGGSQVQNPSRGRYDEVPGPRGTGGGGRPQEGTATGVPEEDLESRPLGGMDTQIGQEAGEQGPDRGVSGGPGYLEGPAGAEPREEPPRK